MPGPEATTDDELLDFARRNGNTGYHLVGTCRMGPATDTRCVVDDELRVHGIDGLRVVAPLCEPKPRYADRRRLPAPEMLGQCGAHGDSSRLRPYFSIFL